MRMWMVEVARLCRKHLIAEHLEIHMFVGAINEGKSIQGYIDNGLIDVDLLRTRHKEVVDEMRLRGYKHNSPLPMVKYRYFSQWRGNNTVDVDASYRELARRCKDCRKRISKRRW